MRQVSSARFFKRNFLVLSAFVCVYALTSNSAYACERVFVGDYLVEGGVVIPTSQIPKLEDEQNGTSSAQGEDNLEEIHAPTVKMLDGDLMDPDHQDAQQQGTSKQDALEQDSFQQGEGA